MAKGTLVLRQIQLGDNADTSKNFIISVPAVADGTLVIERGNGTDVLSVAADGKVTLNLADGTVAQADLEAAIVPLGVGQTWQDVTGSRVLGTTYTNTTGRPIMVFVNSTTLTGTAYVNMTVNGLMVANNCNAASGVGTDCGINVIVPAGATYVLNGNGMSSWKELR